MQPANLHKIFSRFKARHVIRYEHLFNEDFLQFDETFVNKIESSNFTYTANGKRQI